MGCASKSFPESGTGHYSEAPGVTRKTPKMITRDDVTYHALALGGKARQGITAIDESLVPSCNTIPTVHPRQMKQR